MRIWCIVDRWSRYLVCAYIDQTNEGRVNLAVASFSSEDPCCKKIDDPSAPVEVVQTYDLICRSVPPSVIDSSFGRMARKRNRLDPEVESLIASTIQTYMMPRNQTIRTIYLLLCYQIKAANHSRPPAQRLRLPALSTVARRMKEFRQANTDQFQHLSCYELPISIMVDRGHEFRL